MKIINIFALILIPIFAISCTNKTINKVNDKNWTILKKQTEKNNAFVINAKKQLMSLVGNENFDHYVIQRGILNCQANEKQSECVLNFYLTEVEKLNADIKVKKAISDTQEQFNKSLYFNNEVKNYCNLSTDFINMLYTKSTPKLVTYYQQLFKLSNKELATLTTKINNDSYSKFLISENPTVSEEMKTDFMHKCLVKPTTYIINYSVLFR